MAERLKLFHELSFSYGSGWIARVDEDERLGEFRACHLAQGFCQVLSSFVGFANLCLGCYGSLDLYRIWFELRVAVGHDGNNTAQLQSYEVREIVGFGKDHLIADVGDTEKDVYESLDNG